MEIGDGRCFATSLSRSLFLPPFLPACLSISTTLPRTLRPSSLHRIHPMHTYSYTYVHPHAHTHTHRHEVRPVFSLVLCTVLRFFLLLLLLLFVLSCSFFPSRIRSSRAHSSELPYRVSRSENSSVGPGQESLMNLRLEVSPDSRAVDTGRN